MDLAVGADIAGAVHGEPDGQVLQRDVMHDLVEGALQERRIDRRERLHAVGRQSGGERHRMLFSETDVEGAVGKFLFE